MLCRNMRRRKVTLGLVLAIMFVSVVGWAQPQPGTEYVVAVPTTLEAIAQAAFGDAAYAPAIMAATNRRHVEDPAIAHIYSLQTLIEAGWKLWIPDREWADHFLAMWSPFKPELLFATPPGGQLVVASWWTAGGEAEGLHALFDIYSRRYPGVEIVNATVAGGAGFVFRAVIKPRLIAGDPPDTFQLHAGLSVAGYSPLVFLEPLDDLFAAEGWEEVFPTALLELLVYRGHFWGVPVNIHRTNVLWYDRGIFEKHNLTPPRDWDEFFAIAATLREAGIVPIAMGTAGGWEAPHVFETILMSTLGAERYRGLWTGDTSWSDPGVTEALEILKRMLDYANPGHPALTWTGAGEYLIAGKGAMLIMGDWANGWFMAKGYENYGWAPVPGTQGIFGALSDTFALPRLARNRANALAWLRVGGSREGQIAFNMLKGSIPARTDLTAEEKAQFNEYLRSTIVDWGRDAIVPSVVHGAAAIPSWLTDFNEAITFFLVTEDVSGTQRTLIAAAEMALGF